MNLNFIQKLPLKCGFGKCGLTFRGYQSVAKPTNRVLSAKIIVLRENRRTTQEKPAIADNRC
jgi:hypothetical protein